MHIFHRVRSVFTTLALGLGALLAPGPAANPVALAATTYIVNDNSGDCGSFVSTYLDIQTAVTDAITGSVKTILVCPGSYNDFDVVGANKLTVKAALPGTFPTVNAPVADSGTIVYVQDSTGVVLDGLKIDGTNFNDTLTNTAYGVEFYNASGTVQNSSITRLRCFPNGCAYGYGIVLSDDNSDGKTSTLTVKNASITDFDATGIYAYGPTKLTVSGARLTGDFSGGTVGNPYGVYYSSGATGSVTKSTISNVDTGVILIGTSKVTVSGSTIEDAFFGVFIQGFCGPGYETASSNKVTGNTFSDIISYGVYISSSGSGCTHADKNTISGNRISGASGGGAGVFFSVDSGAFADKNKVSRNAIFSFAGDIVTDLDATNTSISGNTWIP